MNVATEKFKLAVIVEQFKEIMHSKVLLNSLILALLINSGYIANLMGASGIVRESFLLPWLVGLFLLSLLVNLKTWKEFKILPIATFFIFIIIFGILGLIHGINNYALANFIRFIAISSITIQTLRQKINIKKLMLFNVIILVLGMYLTYQHLFLRRISVGLWLGFSYNLLFPLFACLFVVLKKNFNKWLRVMSGITFLVYIRFFLHFAARGAYLFVLIVCIVLFVFYWPKCKKIMIRNFIGITVVSGFIYIFFSDIIIFIYNLFYNFGIEIRALYRMVGQLEAGGITTSGRNQLVEEALTGIRESLFLGNGVGTFMGQQRGATYPHNVYLQFFYEGGFFYFLFLLLITVLFLYQLIFSPKNYEKLLLILFFSIGFLPLLISFEYWRNIRFWIAIYYLGWYTEEKLSQQNRINKIFKLLNQKGKQLNL